MDTFDDIFSDGAPKNVKAGGKFQPKAKRGPPRKEPFEFAPSSESIRNEDAAGSETITQRTEKPSESDGGSSLKILTHENGNSKSLDQLSDEVHTKNNEDLIVAQHLDARNSDRNESSLSKLRGEDAGIFVGLDSLDNFHSQLTTITDALVNHVSDMEHAEEVGIRVVPAVDDMLQGSSTAHYELPVTAEPSIHVEAVVANTNEDFCVENRQLEPEAAEGFSPLDTVDELSDVITGSGKRTAKFKPKSKIQIQRKKSTCPSEVEPVPCQQDDGILASSTSPELLINKDSTDFTWVSHSDAAVPGEHSETVFDMPLKAASGRTKSRMRKFALASDISAKQKTTVTNIQQDEAGRSLRPRRKRTNVSRLVDGSEGEDLDDSEEDPSEHPHDSVMSGDGDEGYNDEEYQVENDYQNKSVQRKSKKPVVEKQKSVRKQKKSDEVSDQSNKSKPKKFSHSTRRNRQLLDKALLEIPEDEIITEQLSLRNIILLAEYRERTAKKDAKTSRESTGDASAPCNEDQAFDSQEWQQSDEQLNFRDQESSSPLFNYHSFMKKTPNPRWSKQETELFYEAVRQFGTDLSMMELIFPGRTRSQLKFKYKKEERMHPDLLHQAITSHPKDFSHWKVAIARQQQIAVEAKQNAYLDDSIEMMGEEDAEKVITETNEESPKPEHMEEGEVQDIQSPVKSDGSEDDDWYRFSQYKSEF